MICSNGSCGRAAVTGSESIGSVGRGRGILMLSSVFKIDHKITLKNLKGRVEF